MLSRLDFVCVCCIPGIVSLLWIFPYRLSLT